MKIAISTNLFPPVISGTASYSYDICKALSNYGHEVFLIAPELPGRTDFSDAGISDPSHVLALPAWKIPSNPLIMGFSQLRSVIRPGTLGRVVDFLARHEVEFIYQQSHAFDTAIYTRLAAQRLGIPRAVAHHTNIAHPNKLFNFFLRWGEKIWLKNLYLKPDDLWICPDAFTLEYCTERFAGMPVANVTYGVSPFQHCDNPDVLREAEEIKKRHSPIIVSLGHVTNCRDRVDLIEALGLLKGTYPNIGLVVIGDTQVTYPLNKARELGLEYNVYFLGKRSRSEIRPFLDIADLEAHWYFDASTFGIATLEVMASGVCCLASCDENCYGEDLFKEGYHYGRVQEKNPADIAEKVNYFLQNDRSRQDIGKNAASFIESRYSWKTVAKHLTAEFEAYRKRCYTRR